MPSIACRKGSVNIYYYHLYGRIRLKNIITALLRVRKLKATWSESAHWAAAAVNFEAQLWIPWIFQRSGGGCCAMEIRRRLHVILTLLWVFQGRQIQCFFFLWNWNIAIVVCCWKGDHERTTFPQLTLIWRPCCAGLFVIRLSWLYKGLCKGPVWSLIK